MPRLMINSSGAHQQLETHFVCFSFGKDSVAKRKKKALAPKSQRLVHNWAQQMNLQTGPATPTTSSPRGKRHLYSKFPVCPWSLSLQPDYRLTSLRAPCPGGREYSLHACRTNKTVKYTILQKNYKEWGPKTQLCIKVWHKTNPNESFLCYTLICKF